VGAVTVKVSIIITNFNYGHFLGAAIDSALAVDYDNKEVIV
jgi:glycosyltransferase involved in cell wall biosynthesis